MATIALAGDTMLGRGVAARLVADPAAELFSAGVRDLLAAADLTVLNLECCISGRGEPWPERRFHFRAPPRAAEALAALGVGCVTLANNHALDFGFDALADTLDGLRRAGVRTVGAGPDLAAARAPAILAAGGTRVAVLGLTDHPADYAAAPDRPGVAHADLFSGVPGWAAEEIRRLRGDAEVVLVTPHWGPNMTADPLPYVRAAAADLVGAGATLVAGHSAHVFHGVTGRVLYDLGDFIDDYAVDPRLRNDLGLLFLVTLDGAGPPEVRAAPLALDYGRTRLAEGAEREWVRTRFATACAALGAARVVEEDGLLAVRPTEQT
ncbi:CapA family protein [Actinomadura craniellae]|uniref:CapA family protein n=1 Tax=Actinomadura craniellae TaxID=2231787 RepID=A0A365H405_9ACTN|nr:CapA family protein [Actinomadura craniellae]RAY13779.1 CapA family protein [Actinomadura craniellae]